MQTCIEKGEERRSEKKNGKKFFTGNAGGSVQYDKASIPHGRREFRQRGTARGGLLEIFD